MRKTKINESIEADKVLLISSDGKQLGVVKFQEALQQAKKQELDLVLMNEQSAPPVCKILDFKKRIFEKKKQIGSAKRNVKRTNVKEIKFRPDTDQGDYNVKMKRLVKFLEAGDRVKVTIRFRGREIVYKERGYEMLVRVEKDLAGIADIEQQSKLEGKLLTAVFKPLPKSAAKSQIKSQQESQLNIPTKPSEPQASESKPAEPQADKQSASPDAKPQAESQEEAQKDKPAKPQAKPQPKQQAKSPSTSNKPAQSAKPQPKSESKSKPRPQLKSPSTNKAK